MDFHVQVLNKIADQMQENSNDLFEIKLKVNVLTLLAGTMIQTAKTIGVLSRDDWLQTHKRVNQLLTLIQRPVFIKSLKEAHAPVEAPKGANETDVEKLMESRQQFETERQVFPSLSNFAEGLNEQLWRAYQNLQPTSIDYL